MGIGTERVWIDWDETEPLKDSYDWARMDQKVANGNTAGIELLGYFSFTPAWAKKDAACQADICAISDMGEFRQFARDVAQRYDGNHRHGLMKYIEILNEVTAPAFFDGKNTKYTDWLVAGYEGVKEGNPQAHVLLGGLVNPLTVKAFVEQMLRDYHQYFDIVSYHVYDSDADVAAASAYLQEEMSRLGVHKPMWLTETATITSTKPDWQKVVARGLVKRHVSAFGNGAARVFWWPFVGHPAPEEDARFGDTKEKTLGLGWVYPKGSGMPTDQFHPRQAYDTLGVMTSRIGGFSSVQKISGTQYKFTVHGSEIYVLWCDTGTCWLPAQIQGTVTVTDYLGTTETKPASDIRLTEAPLFVRPGG